jgi:hypothetical protein
VQVPKPKLYIEFTKQLQEVPYQTTCIYTFFLDTISSVADPDPDQDPHRSSSFLKIGSSDPDLDPHRSQKPNTEPHQSQKPEAVEAQNGTVEAHK